MSAQSDPRHVVAKAVDPKYYFRRSLTMRELAPAIGAAVAAGLATFYVAKLFIERTPLERPPKDTGALRRSEHRSGSHSSALRKAGRR
jgi:hypothetical protein